MQQYFAGLLLRKFLFIFAVISSLPRTILATNSLMKKKFVIKAPLRGGGYSFLVLLCFLLSALRKTQIYIKEGATVFVSDNSVTTESLSDNNIAEIHLAGGASVIYPQKINNSQIAYIDSSHIEKKIKERTSIVLKVNHNSQKKHKPQVKYIKQNHQDNYHCSEVFTKDKDGYAFSYILPSFIQLKFIANVIASLYLFPENLNKNKEIFSIRNIISVSWKNSLSIRPPPYIIANNIYAK